MAQENPRRSCNTAAVTAVDGSLPHATLTVNKAPCPLVADVHEQQHRQGDPRHPRHLGVSSSRRLLSLSIPALPGTRRGSLPIGPSARHAQGTDTAAGRWFFLPVGVRKTR